MKRSAIWCVLLIGLLLSPSPLHSRSVDAPIPLPTDRPLLKIEVVETAVITLTHADLLAAGVDSAVFNPNRLQLVQRGHSVAFRWLGDGDSQFESDEAIQFYAWAFDGSRYEKQFVSQNVFWLWSGDAPANSVAVEAKPPQGGTPTQTHRATLTVEPENDFFSGWTDQWHAFPNAPDAWYWRRLPQAGSGLVETAVSLPITLPNPAPNGTPATLTTEFFSRARSASPGAVANEVMVQLNESDPHSLAWSGRRSVNLEQSVTAVHLQNGENSLNLTLTTPDVLYLNRATVEFEQQLVLDGASLTFTVAQAGDVLVDVGETAVSDLHLWDITDRHQPSVIALNNENLTADGLRFNQAHNTPQTYFLKKLNAQQLTANSQQLTILNLQSPVPNPQSSVLNAEWLAITHPSLASQANRLAAYRSAEMPSGVVSIDDIIDQFGYGLPLPSAITAYLQWAHANWDVPPRYVVLFGDATLNPRQLDCAWSCTSTGWDSAEPTLIPTDLLFVDRFQGLAPSDQTLGMLDDDLLPDVMIGRIAAQTVAEAEAAVSKIMRYETAVSLQTHADKAVLFLADNSDAAGDFCQQNALTAHWLPAFTQHKAYCLPDSPAPDSVAQINGHLFAQINGDGAYLLNYRGHGSVQYWGGGGDILLSVANEGGTLSAWRNPFPTVIVSADCLDGHFAWPGLPSVSETLLTLPKSGTAAHWSSTGLGADHEHTLMHQNFYRAFQQPEVNRMGEAIRFAQAAYLDAGAHVSPLYSFTLQGDPALKFDWVRYNALFLPLIRGEYE